MYLKKIYDENLGPIEKLNLELPFHENGNPKPIIFVGENGSGKSTLLSNIVDAFYELAGKHYRNVLYDNDYGEGNQYYKAITSLEVKDGKKFACSYIQFINTPIIHYIFKVGKFSVAQCKECVIPQEPFSLHWDENGNDKRIQATSKEVEAIFSNNVLCFFGPDRYEKPAWLGEKYYKQNNLAHLEINSRWNGILENPISVKNVTEKNLQWLLDVIVDSRPDIKGDEHSLQLDHIDATSLLILRKARENLETIMSKILGKAIYFSLNIRSVGGARFRICEKNTNKVIAPSLDSLSTGQIALFNMFSTIVRYADNNDVNHSITLSDITGIVVIDEIELHLHTNLQKSVLPKLIKLFPKVQFVITSHAPLFLLGMQEEFGEDEYEIYEMPNATKISVERFSEFQRAYEYFKTTQTYQKDAETMLFQLTPKTKAVIITEGATDWKHIKTAFNILKDNPTYTDLFDGLDIEFLEYEPANSSALAEHKLEMGKDTLKTLCENICKIPQKTKHIFIADNDDPDIVKKMSEHNKSFKDWSNNVYSFVLPVPQSRQTTPNICIEHLYSDMEIKTEIEENGVLRRLYIGNEFDKRGLAAGIDRVCEKPKKCGPDKIDIIEGSKGEKVTAISDNAGAINYALPKTAFAKYVSENPNKFNFDNFLEIFRIIKAIIGDATQQ